jgi:hypothetical protein
VSKITYKNAVFFLELHHKESLSPAYSDSRLNVEGLFLFNFVHMICISVEVLFFCINRGLKGVLHVMLNDFLFLFSQGNALFSHDHRLCAFAFRRGRS